MKDTIPSQKILKEAFKYCNKTGKLYWKKRPLSHFNNQHRMNNINSKFYAKEAFTYETNDGYKQGSIFGVSALLHRVIYKYHFGYLPDLIDHADRNTSNNRIENLRVLSKSENALNSKKIRPDNKTGVKGVSLDKRTGKFRAYINHLKKRYELGCFKEIESAIKARLKAEIKFGHDVLKVENRLTRS